jgi:hypothetical protein
MVVIFGNERFRQPPVFYEILSKLEYEYYDIADLDVHRRTRAQLYLNPDFYDEVANKGVWYDRAAA